MTFISANQQRAFLCQKSAYGFRLMGLCLDVPPFGTLLEYDDGSGKEGIPECILCPYMSASVFCRGAAEW